MNIGLAVALVCGALLVVGGLVDLQRWLSGSVTLTDWARVCWPVGAVPIALCVLAGLGLAWHFWGP